MTTGNIIEGAPISSNKMQVNFRSTECKLIFGKNVIADDFEVNFNGLRQTVTIGDNCRIRGVIHLANFDNHVTFGSGTLCHAMFWMSVSENSRRIDIGENCLLASVKFRTSDSHKIINIESGEIINRGEDIKIGDRVWIAEDALILKGAIISNDTIVAARSLVVSETPPNVLIGGSPARVIRVGVRWEL